jgi:hypothetical protein
MSILAVINYIFLHIKGNFQNLIRFFTQSLHGSKPTQSTNPNLTPHWDKAFVVLIFVSYNRLIESFKAFSQVFEIYLTLILLVKFINSAFKVISTAAIPKRWTLYLVIGL